MTKKIKKYKHKLSPKYEIDEIITTANITNTIDYKKIKPELICNVNRTSNCYVCINKKCFTI
jgi:hypothetical protein